MRKPIFSVIIPALNEEKFLPKLLASLAKQTAREFEVIVVDASSRDHTVDEAKKFAHKLPALTILSTKKRNLPFQRNFGAAHANGEWLIFIDADSVLMPYFIDRVKDYISVQDPRVFTTWALPDSESNSDAIFTLFTNVYYEATVLFKRPLTPGPLTAIRKDVFDEMGGYDESHAYNEDAELGLRLAKSGYMLSILREALYIWSMRRIRREGKMKVMQQYVLSVLPILVFKKPFKHMPGYIMGGQLYKKRKHTKRSMLSVYERKLQSLVQELVA